MGLISRKVFLSNTSLSGLDRNQPTFAILSLLPSAQITEVQVDAEGRPFMSLCQEKADTEDAVIRKFGLFPSSMKHAIPDGYTGIKKHIVSKDGITFYFWELVLDTEKEELLDDSLTFT